MDAKYTGKLIGILAMLIGLIVIMSLTTGDTFLTAYNLENVARRTALYGILSIGVAFVIMTGGIDLSIGSIVAIIGVLLAKFLAVGYVPFDHAPIEQVRGAQQEIVIEGQLEGFEPGQRVRFFGGRRAQPAVVTIAEIAYDEDGYTAPDGSALAVTRVHLEQPLSADDRHGHIAAVTPVVQMRRDAETNLAIVTLEGRHERLQPRDRLRFYGPDGGQARAAITEVELLDGQTRLHMDRQVEVVDEGWLVIPHKRRQTMSIPAALASVMGIGLFLGLLHGLLVAKLNLQPFVVTLCGLLIYRGVARWLVDDQTVGFGSEYADVLTPLARGSLQIWQTADGTTLGIPYPVIILAVVAVLAMVFLNLTIWGRYILALGRNEEAARFSGINTAAVTILAYVICTGLATLGAVLFALDSNSVTPSNHGYFFELYAIAAAVLGGCSLRGGEGGILGVVVGAAVMRVLYNMIVLRDYSTQLEFAIIGGVILAGVAIDEIIRRIAAKRRTARKAAAREREAPPPQPAAG